MKYHLSNEILKFFEHFSKFSERFGKEFKIDANGSMREGISYPTIPRSLKTNKPVTSYDLFSKKWLTNIHIHRDETRHVKVNSLCPLHEHAPFPPLDLRPCYGRSARTQKSTQRRSGGLIGVLPLSPSNCTF